MTENVIVKFKLGKYMRKMFLSVSDKGGWEDLCIICFKALTRNSGRYLMSNNVVINCKRKENRREKVGVYLIHK